MQTHHVVLESPASTSYRCTRAADSLDIDVTKKLRHELRVDVNLETPWSLGVIVGASGSGKTTLARTMFESITPLFRDVVDASQPVIDQFPQSWTYEQCAAALTGVGLTAVPTWLRPVGTLSNGQRARADAALQLAQSTLVVIDEWTSVVDRTVAKVMSHCVAKHARRSDGRQLVLLSCHYDVLDWLNADWVIDCNMRTFTDRRALWRDFRRSETLAFDIRPCSSRIWPLFSQYHYLSDKLPGGGPKTFGLFHADQQIGFQCFAQYVPQRDRHGTRMVHSNRTVIHPDYAGLGLGIRFIDATSAMMTADGYDVRAKFSSVPVYRAMVRDPNWRFVSMTRPMKSTVTNSSGLSSGRARTTRQKVSVFNFTWIGGCVASMALARR